MTSLPVLQVVRSFGFLRHFHSTSRLRLEDAGSNGLFEIPELIELKDAGHREPPEKQSLPGGSSRDFLLAG
jgi:hypothetical protein